MDNRLLGAFKGFVGALNQLRTRLGQHLNLDVVGNPAFINQFPAKIEIRLTG